jgi:hypothetical protein
MLFLNRRPGERLVIQTPEGRITIDLLPDQILAVEAPPGVEVLEEAPDATEATPVRAGGGASWLPSRPPRLEF